MRRITTAMSLAAVLVLAAAASVVPTVALASGGGGCGSPVTERAGTRVAIRDFCFSPTILRVEPGQEVVFANRDPLAHNVLGANGIWGSYESLKRGRDVAYGFAESGVYPFVCIFHPGMIGAIVVGDGVGRAFEATTADGPVALAAAPEFERAGGLVPDGSGGVPWAFVLIVGITLLAVTAGATLARRRGTKA